MSRGLQVVKDWLSENEWSPEPTDNRYSFCDRYQIADEILNCYFRILPDLEQFLFLLVPMDLTVPEERRADVAELILRLNHGMRMGCFGMEFDSGQINFQASVNYYESEFSSQSVTNIVGPALEAFELYLKAFLGVIEDGRTPGQVIEEIDYPQANVGGEPEGMDESTETDGPA